MAAEMVMPVGQSIAWLLLWPALACRRQREDHAKTYALGLRLAAAAAVPMLQGGSLQRRNASECGPGGDRGRPRLAAGPRGADAGRARPRRPLCEPGPGAPPRARPGARERARAGAVARQTGASQAGALQA